MPSTYMQERRARLMQEGRCVDCLRPKGAKRQTVQRCCRCQKKKNSSSLYHQPAMVRRGLNQEPGPRSGWILCKRCDKKFWSDDYRRITRCQSCQRWMSDAEYDLANEGARFDAIGAEGFACVRNQLTGITGTMKQRVIKANVMTKAQVGVTCRHLTKQEIADRYTPEYCAALFAKAHNNDTTRYTELKQL